MDDPANDYITFLTTAACNGNCRYCSVRPWMTKNKGYQIPLNDVADFVFFSKESGYRYKEIEFAGGEPLLWENILPAAEGILKGDITDEIAVVTNGLLINADNHDFISEVSRLVTTIRVSAYLGNEDRVQYALDHFGNVESRFQVNRPVTPDKFIPDTLPAICKCTGRGFAHGEVSICGPVRSMGYLESSDTEGLSTPLRQSFLSVFDGAERENQPCCQACIGNTNIHPHVKWVQNEV